MRPTLMTLVAGAAVALSAIVAPAFADAKVTLTYLADPNWVKDAEKTLAKKFEEQDWNRHRLPDWCLRTSIFNVLKTKLNSGEAPDLYGGQSGVTDLKLNYNVEKNAVDLSNETWAKLEDPLVAAQSTVERQAVRSDLLGHHRVCLGGQLLQADLCQIRADAAHQLCRLQGFVPEAAG